MEEAGVYPVRSITREWFLDQNRKPPKLRVKRHQLPLAPGFAMTAHASQGKTLEVAIVDLQIPVTASWITIYVALSRVRRADDLLIFREFDKEQLQRGNPLGPSTLLKKLRGENIDWVVVRDKLTPPKKCSSCLQRLSFIWFSDDQWQGGARDYRECLTCQQEGPL